MSASIHSTSTQASGQDMLSESAPYSSQHDDSMVGDSAKSENLASNSKTRSEKVSTLEAGEVFFGALASDVSSLAKTAMRGVVKLAQEMGKGVSSLAHWGKQEISAYFAKDSNSDHQTVKVAAISDENQTHNHSTIIACAAMPNTPSQEHMG